MSSNNNSIYFCVVHQQRQVCGYTWKIWWDRTSFYLKGQDKWMASLKVSLHGNDPRHGRPGFKIARDVDAEQTARKAGGVLVTAPGNLPAWFEGRRVAPSVRHAVRFRSVWKMFGLGVPSASVPKRPKKSTLAAILPAPRNMRALDVDIFVCEREPYWPNQAITSADNASLGPLKTTPGNTSLVVWLSETLSVTIKTRWMSAPVTLIPMIVSEDITGESRTASTCSASNGYRDRRCSPPADRFDPTAPHVDAQHRHDHVGSIVAIGLHQLANSRTRMTRTMRQSLNTC